MCGLYASIGFAPDERRIDIVAHRGPDGRGWRVFETEAGPVALGHRRLAIIDVTDAGLQPMADPTGRYHLVFNGEIYNYRELREELARAGEVFRTASDSEVLLRAYIAWGADALAKLRGMFAFAVFDARDGVLFAARDRFGIKPLYVLMRQRGFAIASEIKQLIGLCGSGASMDVARVCDFLESGISDHTAQTMFAGITQLRGGEYVEISTRGGEALQAAIKRWYAIPAASPLRLGEAEAAERFRHLFEDSIGLHMRSDVQVGSCLSGGLDSSSIVCLVSKREAAASSSAPLHTVSACYDDRSVDEKPFMDAVVAHTGTTPHFVYPHADDVRRLASDITWHQDEPFGTTSIVAQWRVFETAHGVGNKVMLDGQGADEQLAGYHWVYPFHLARLLRRGRLDLMARTIAQRRKFHGASARRQLMSLAANLLPAGIVGTLRRRDGWLAPGLAGARSSVVDTARRELGLPPPKDIASLCVLMTFASNLQMLLHWEDRNSMAHSIEARVPFLDHPLVEFSLALGNAHKVVGADTKQVLRRAMGDVLPAAVSRRRDKLGFATPENAWFKGPLRPMLQDGLEATIRRFPQLFDAAALRERARRSLEGAQALDPVLWRVVNLGIWGERFDVSL